jgi:pimeloyl-ACP methyl ester carboxylesterase
MLDRSLTAVHGGGDVWVDPSEPELLVAARPSAAPAVRRIAVDDAGHDLAEASPGLIAQIAEDLANRLQARPLPPVLIAIEEMG